MSWRSTGLLALVVAVVLFVAYRDVTGEDPDAGWDVVFVEPLPTVPANDIELAIAFEPKSVAALSVRSGARRVETRRTAYGWTNLTNPRAIEDFLSSLTKLAVILRIEGEPSTDDLTAYGLEQPNGRIALTLTDGREITIELGNHNPSGTGIYAKVSNRPGVILTGAVAVWEIDRVLSDLDKQADTGGT